jgi:hypothetical protein
MDLQCPSRLLGLANEHTRLPIRRWPLGKVDRFGIDSAEAKGRRHALMAAADRCVRGQTAVRSGERFDRGACVLQALAKEVGRYPERLGQVLSALRKSNCASLVTVRTRISCVASSASSRFQSMRSARP